MALDVNTQISQSPTMGEYQDQGGKVNPGASQESSSVAPQVVIPGKAFTGSDPTREPSIKEAWAAAEALVGKTDFDEEASKPSVTKEAETEQPETESVEAQSEEVDDNDKPVDVKPKAKAKGKDKEPEELDEKKFTAKERSAFIAERRELRERFNRKEQRLTAEISSKQAQLANEITQAQATFGPLIAAAQAIEAGDFDGIAKHLGAFLKNPELQDWTTLNSEALKAMQSPVYKNMRRLEKEQAEFKQEQARRYQEQEAQRHEQAKQAEIASYKRDLTAELEDSDDPFIPAALAAKPQLTDVIFNIQQNHYQKNHGELLSSRDAFAQFLTQVRDEFQLWQKLIEEHSESELLADFQASRKKPVTKQSNGNQIAKASERQTGKKLSGPSGKVAERQREVEAELAAIAQAPVRPLNVSHSQTAQASAQRPMSDKELKNFFTKKMEQDFEQAGLR